MADLSPPTSADYAQANSSDALRAVRRLERRIEKLENALAELLAVIKKYKEEIGA